MNAKRQLATNRCIEKFREWQNEGVKSSWDDVCSVIDIFSQLERENLELAFLEGRKSMYQEITSENSDFSNGLHYVEDTYSNKEPETKSTSL